MSSAMSLFVPSDAATIPAAGARADDNTGRRERVQFSAVDAPLSAHPVERTDRVLFLGREDAGQGAPYFATHISNISNKSTFAEVPLRDVAATIGDADLARISVARSLVDWYRRLQFCSSCGKQVEILHAGHSAKCTGCSSEIFPRVNPVAIMLVLDGKGNCLLGMGKGRMQAMKYYSALAGYISPGETVEECARREVKEEVGVDVRDVRYHMSQPWPFPYQLMMGCYAVATDPSQAISIDPDEIVAAKWWSKDDVRRALVRENPELRVPDRIAIAHHLMRIWVDGGVDDVGQPTERKSNGSKL